MNGADAFCNSQEGQGRPRRIAYVKSGPVATEVRASLGESTPSDGGPLAFIEHFLHQTHNNDCLVISINSRRDEWFAAKGIYAEAWDRNTVRPVLAARLFKRLVTFKPDIILCGEMGLAAIISRTVAKLFNIPLIIACFNRLMDEHRSPSRQLLHAVAARCLRGADTVIAHGPYITSQLLEAGVNQDKILEFDWRFLSYVTASKEECPYDLTEGGRCTVVLCIARMVVDKGVTDLLEALAPRLATDDSLRLVFVGDGPAKVQVENRAAELGIADKVKMVGAVSYATLPTIGRQASVVVTPSRGAFPEGRPMTVHESLSLGVPVISPDYGPFPYAVQHGVNGLIYPASSVEGLRAALERFLGDADLRAALANGATDTGRQIAENTHEFGWALQQALCRAAESLAIRHQCNCSTRLMRL